MRVVSAANTPWGAGCSAGWRAPGAVGLRFRPRLLPVRVGLKRREALLARPEVRVPQQVDQAVAGADVLDPVGDVGDAVLLEQLHGVVGEAVVQVRQLARHGVVDAQFLHVGVEARLRRIRRQAHEAVHHLRHDGAVGFRLGAHLLPARIGLEGGPLGLAVGHAVERQDVGQPVADADFVGPEAQHADAVLAEEPHGVVGEACVEGCQAARHGVVDAGFVEHGCLLGEMTRGLAVVASGYGKSGGG